MHTKFSKKLINPPVTAGHEQGDCRPLHELLDNSCFRLTIRKNYQYFQFNPTKILLFVTWLSDKCNHLNCHLYCLESNARSANN